MKQLRSPEQISEASELLYSEIREGKVDGKQVDGLNTLIKNQIYLNVKLRMDYLKIYTQARAKKIDLPIGLLPDGLQKLIDGNSL